MKKAADAPKLTIGVISKKGHNNLLTVSVYDNRARKFWTFKQIAERGIGWFLNLDDLKETANWNLNGDSKKYRFKWEQNSPEKSIGYAYIFD